MGMCENGGKLWGRGGCGGEWVRNGGEWWGMIGNGCEWCGMV